MKIAIISYIHANLDAFQLVLSNIKRDNVEKILIAGDFIGYYYHPEKVINICMYREDIFCIKGNHDQIERLFIQLRKRQYSISHKKAPSFSLHSSFVKNLPYRVWFIIKINKLDCGNIYVQYDNSIGLNCCDELCSEEIREVLDYVTSKVKPLKFKPSIRSKNFFLNLASTNIDLQGKLVSIGYMEKQRSYSFPDS